MWGERDPPVSRDLCPLIHTGALNAGLRNEETIPISARQGDGWFLNRPPFEPVFLPLAGLSKESLKQQLNQCAFLFALLPSLFLIKEKRQQFSKFTGLQIPCGQYDL